MGSNRYGESQAAGFGQHRHAGLRRPRGIIGNALESSNVDIAQEFTRMILAQRGYQANSAQHHHGGRSPGRDAGSEAVSRQQR